MTRSHLIHVYSDFRNLTIRCKFDHNNKRTRFSWCYESNPNISGFRMWVCTLCLAQLRNLTEAVELLESTQCIKIHKNSRKRLEPASFFATVFFLFEMVSFLLSQSLALKLTQNSCALRQEGTCADSTAEYSGQFPPLPGGKWLALFDWGFVRFSWLLITP